MCPVHDEERCPANCAALAEWRLIAQGYSALWRDRARGVQPWDTRKHGIRAHLGMKAA